MSTDKDNNDYQPRALNTKSLPIKTNRQHMQNFCKNNNTLDTLDTRDTRDFPQLCNNKLNSTKSNEQKKWSDLISKGQSDNTNINTNINTKTLKKKVIEEKDEKVIEEKDEKETEVKEEKDEKETEVKEEKDEKETEVKEVKEVNKIIKITDECGWTTIPKTKSNNNNWVLKKIKLKEEKKEEKYRKSNELTDNFLNKCLGSSNDLNN